MVVYWAPYFTDSYYLNIEQPESILSEYHKLIKNSKDQEFLRCPSVINFSKNIFSIKSPIFYSFMWNGEELKCDENFNNSLKSNQVLVRDMNNGIFSISCPSLIFFCEEDVEMSLCGAFLSNNDITENSNLISGKFNISRWFRPIDMAFILKEKAKNKILSVKQGDVLMYVTFYTNEPVVFKKFHMNENLHKIVDYVKSQSKFQYDKNIKTYFEKIYSLFDKSKSKNFILKNIKENLME